MSKTRKKKIKNIGGKVLASGGYGCVFSPALKCIGSQNREKNTVSKLMTTSHAKDEYEEIHNIKNKLNKIDNFKDFFLLYNISLCAPAKLQTTDLTEFTSKCTALPKNNITTKNINTKLNEVMILNMPNGGLPVDDYIYSNGSFNKLGELHECLTELLKKGILPMNKQNIFHNDIKDSNILVDSTEKQLKTRLIDWGLATEYTPFKNDPFPKSWKNRPFQFNVPFSVIIFSDDFVEKYTAFLESCDYSKEDNLKPFVIDYISFWNKKRGAGHYKFINEIFYLLYGNNLNTFSDSDKPKIIETEFTMPTIVNYIMSVLKKYTNLNQSVKLNLREYLDNVFIKNIDIWGFVNCYYPFLELLSENFKHLTEIQKETLDHFKELFINTYLCADEPIDLSKLFSNLHKIKQLLHKKNYSKITKTSSVRTDYGRGMKTRKSNIENKLFKRKPKQKRFKKPFFLSF